MICRTIATTALVGACAGALSISYYAGLSNAPAQARLVAQPENTGQPTPEQIKAMMAQTAAKAPEHKRLDALVGTWNAKMSFLMAPGGVPEVSQMKAEIKPVLGGRYVQSHYKGVFKFMGADIDFEGMGMMGYDKAAGKFTSAWGDNLSTSMLYQSGTFKDGAIDLRGEMPDGMGGTMAMRHRHIVNDDGSYTLEFYQPNPLTGELAKIGWIEHTKP